MANNNDDSDDNGFTDLEEYLNWMAEPHFFVNPSSSALFNLSEYFAGYKSPAFSIDGPSGMRHSLNGSQLTVYPQAEQLLTFNVTVTEDGISLTRTFNVLCSSQVSAIRNVTATSNTSRSSNIVYDLPGRQLTANSHNLQSLSPRGIYIVDGKKTVR